MELWIRSQDKSSIVKVDNLYVSVGNYICYYVEKGKEVPNTYYRPSGELGRYETKERALEVLDEIQSHISILNAMSLCHNENMLIALNSAVGEKKLNNMSSPYEMPKE